MEQHLVDTLVKQIIEDKLGPVETMQAEREFVRLLMQERAERHQMLRKLKESAIGHVTIVLLSGLGLIGWQIAKFMFNHAPEFVKEWGTK